MPDVNDARMFARQKLLDALGVVKGAFPTDDTGGVDKGLHRDTARQFTENLIGMGLPQSIAGGLVRGAGNLNESLSALVNEPSALLRSLNPFTHLLLGDLPASVRNTHGEPINPIGGQRGQLFSPAGIDVRDLQANEEGIAAARRR